jgi:hypothetical protein
VSITNREREMFLDTTSIVSAIEKILESTFMKSYARNCRNNGDSQWDRWDPFLRRSGLVQINHIRRNMTWIKRF